MTHAEFETVVNEMMSEIKQTLVAKTAEYSVESDRLSIFKHIAALTQGTPAQALTGLVAKQITSLYEMVNSKQAYDDSVWNEKLKDIIIYMLLLKATVKDTGLVK